MASTGKVRKCHNAIVIYSHMQHVEPKSFLPTFQPLAFARAAVFLFYITKIDTILTDCQAHREL